MLTPSHLLYCSHKQDDREEGGNAHTTGCFFSSQLKLPLISAMALFFTWSTILSSLSLSEGLASIENTSRDEPYCPKGMNISQYLVSYFLFKKLLPVTDRGDLQGCEMLRIPHCIDSRLTDGGKVVSLTRRPRSTSQKHFSTSGTHFCYRLSKPPGLVRL
jgi:hypothetical protein